MLHYSNNIQLWIWKVVIIAELTIGLPGKYLFAFRIFWKETLQGIKEGRTLRRIFAEDAIETLLFSSVEGKYFVDYHLLPKEKRENFERIAGFLQQNFKLVETQKIYVSQTLDIQVAVKFNLENMSKAENKDAIKQIHCMIEAIHQAGGRIQRIDKEIDEYEIIVPSGDNPVSPIHKPKGFCSDLIIFVLFIVGWLILWKVMSWFNIWAHREILIWSLTIVTLCPLLKTIMVFLPQDWKNNF